MIDENGFIQPDAEEPEHLTAPPAPDGNMTGERPTPPQFYGAPAPRPEHKRQSSGQ
jgi:hypothetical protein